MTIRFAVDLDHLAEVIADLNTQQERLAELEGQIDAESRQLHDGWNGRASGTHAAAHARWKAGSAQMRDALAAMTAAAPTAQRNYASAADANLRTWQALG